MEIREFRGEKREKRPSDYGLENALARRQRRLYPTNTIDQTAAEFRLTPGEAKGTVYGSASRSTLNKVLKRGGWALTVELMADVLGQPLERFIEQQAREAANERKRWEEEERRHEAALAAVIERRLNAGRPAEWARETGNSDAALGRD